MYFLADKYYNKIKLNSFKNQKQKKLSDLKFLVTIIIYILIFTSFKCSKYELNYLLHYYEIDNLAFIIICFKGTSFYKLIRKVI